LDLYVVLKDDVQIRLIDAAIEISLAIGRIKTMPTDIITNKLSRYKELSVLPSLERKIARDGVKIYG
jgi:hypothetical protein